MSKCLRGETVGPWDRETVRSALCAWWEGEKVRSSREAAPQYTNYQLPITQISKGNFPSAALLRVGPLPKRTQRQRRAEGLARRPYLPEAK